MSLSLYREESKKIFSILNRYSTVIEKGGTDEAFLDVTAKVNERFKSNRPPIDYAKNHGTKDFWENALFMSIKKDEETGLHGGSFIPETRLEKKLFIANEIAKNIRDVIFNELGYKASAGISFNKTCAKIASS